MSDLSSDPEASSQPTKKRKDSDFIPKSQSPSRSKHFSTASPHRHSGENRGHHRRAHSLVGPSDNAPVAGSSSSAAAHINPIYADSRSYSSVDYAPRHSRTQSGLHVPPIQTTGLSGSIPHHRHTFSMTSADYLGLKSPLELESPNFEENEGFREESPDVSPEPVQGNMMSAPVGGTNLDNIALAFDSLDHHGGNVIPRDSGIRTSETEPPPLSMVWNQLMSDPNTHSYHDNRQPRRRRRGHSRAKSGSTQAHVPRYVDMSSTPQSRSHRRAQSISENQITATTQSQNESTAFPVPRYFMQAESERQGPPTALNFPPQHHGPGPVAVASGVAQHQPRYDVESAMYDPHYRKRARSYTMGDHTSDQGGALLSGKQTLQQRIPGQEQEPEQGLLKPGQSTSAAQRYEAAIPQPGQSYESTQPRDSTGPFGTSFEPIGLGIGIGNKNRSPAKSKSSSRRPQTSYGELADPAEATGTPEGTRPALSQQSAHIPPSVPHTMTSPLMSNSLRPSQVGPSMIYSRDGTLFENRSMAPLPNSQTLAGHSERGFISPYDQPPGLSSSSALYEATGDPLSASSTGSMFYGQQGSIGSEAQLGSQDQLHQLQQPHQRVARFSQIDPAIVDSSWHYRRQTVADTRPIDDHSLQRNDEYLIQVPGDNYSADARTKWSAEDVDELYRQLDNGERYKWKYISEVLSKRLNKRIPIRACQNKFQAMFGESEMGSILRSSLFYVAWRSGWDAINMELTEQERDIEMNRENPANVDLGESNQPQLQSQEESIKHNMRVDNSSGSQNLPPNDFEDMISESRDQCTNNPEATSQEVFSESQNQSHLAGLTNAKNKDVDDEAAS